jgi:hypothetical protein
VYGQQQQQHPGVVAITAATDRVATAAAGAMAPPITAPASRSNMSAPPVHKQYRVTRTTSYTIQRLSEGSGHPRERVLIHCGPTTAASDSRGVFHISALALTMQCFLQCRSSHVLIEAGGVGIVNLVGIERTIQVQGSQAPLMIIFLLAQRSEFVSKVGHNCT